MPAIHCPLPGHRTRDPSESCRGSFEPLWNRQPLVPLPCLFTCCLLSTSEREPPNNRLELRRHLAEFVRRFLRVIGALGGVLGSHGYSAYILGDVSDALSGLRHTA